MTRRPRPRPTRSSSSCSWRRWRAKADPAVGRHAAARGPGARARQPPRRAAARRATRCARPQAAPPDADGAEADPAGGRPDLHPRHPRPGGGHDHGRLHRGHERRAHRAARRPGHPLRAAAVDVRRQLPRAVQPRAREGQPRRHREVVTVPPTAPTSRSRGRTCPTVSRTCGSGCAPRSCASASRAAPTSLRGVVRDVSFSGVATQYFVAHAVGPGAHRRAAERRLGPCETRRDRHRLVGGRARLRARRLAGRPMPGPTWWTTVAEAGASSRRGRRRHRAGAAAQLGALRPAAAGHALARRLLRRCR